MGHIWVGYLFDFRMMRKFLHTREWQDTRGVIPKTTEDAIENDFGEYV